MPSNSLHRQPHGGPGDTSPTINPSLKTKLPLLDGLDDWDTLDPEKRQRIAAYHADEIPWRVPAGLAVSNVAPREHGRPVAMRWYSPAGAPTGAFLWVHGGGFSSGSLDMAESHLVAAELAARTGHAVLTVDYSLAKNGETYPVPLQEVAAAWEHLTASHPHVTCSIGGASAGAALALGAALDARDRALRLPDAVVLVYPFVHFPVPALPGSVLAVVETLPTLVRVTPHAVEKMVKNYVGRLSDIPPRALPGAESPRGLGRVLVVASELDELRPSAELLRRQLDEADVVNTYLVTPGMPHGYLDQSPRLDATDHTLESIASFLTRRGHTHGRPTV